MPPTTIGEERNDLLIEGALVNSSAPMSGGLFRVSLSKSTVIPPMAMPALPAGDVLLTCRSTVEDVPVEFTKSGSPTRECASCPVPVCMPDSVVRSVPAVFARTPSVPET